MAQHEIQCRSSCTLFCMSIVIALSHGCWQWSDFQVIFPLVLSLLSLGLLFVVECYIAKEPMLPPSILIKKVPFLVCMSNFFVSVCNFCIMYFIPLWFQTVSLDSASISGMSTILYERKGTIFSIHRSPCTTAQSCHGFGFIVGRVSSLSSTCFPGVDCRILHVAGAFIERENTRLSISSLEFYRSLASFPSSSCKPILGSSKGGLVFSLSDWGTQLYL